jgi:hypothetical protein
MFNTDDPHDPEDDETTKPDAKAEADPENLLWEQYTVYVDLFKFYVDVTWKSATWFYAITGAILAYFFANIAGNPLVPFALVLPVVLSLGFGYIYFRGISQTTDLEKNLELIRGKLGLTGKPHVVVLKTFLKLASLLSVAVGVFLLVLLVLSYECVNPASSADTWCAPLRPKP